MRRSVALSLLTAGVAAVTSGAAKQKPLNVVYILADDLGYGDVGCYGQTRIKTPNIDRLARNGMMFTQHYSGCTVSAPSRSALMTGMHTGHTFIRGNKPADKSLSPEGQYPIADSVYTIAEMFRDAGYVTGAYGKWGLGYPGSEGEPLKQGFSNFYGYNCQTLAHKYYPTHLWNNTDRVELTGNSPAVQTQYAPDMIQAEALKFIERNRDNSFFLFIPCILPHAELLAPDDSLLAMYKGKFDERPFRAPRGGNYGEGMDWRSYCGQEEPYAHFAAMVSRLDIYVGQVVEKLKELDLEKNTIVIFTSDNGPHIEGGANPDYFDSYGPFRGVKRDMYEGGIRVPMIASCPGTIKAGSVNKTLSAFWDIMPTFAEMTGSKLPKATDGISILPTLTGKKGQKQHEYLYWEFYESGGKIAVRMGDWKGIRLNVSGNPAPPMELYDLSKDIHEDNNVAAQHPEIVAAIEKIIGEAHTDSSVFTF